MKGRPGPISMPPSNLRMSLSKMLQRLSSILTPPDPLRTAAGQPEVLIISYPKTGRTWLRMMLGKYICLKYGLDDCQILDTPVLTDHSGLPVTKFIHDGSNLRRRRSFRLLDPSKSGYREKKVLLLTRSIEDSMVSAYFQVSSRLNIFHGTVSEFLRDERYGVDKFIRFHRDWYSQQAVPQQFDLITYEQMQTDAASVLTTTLEFIGESPVSDQSVRAAAEYCSFDNLRAVEQSQQLARPMQMTDADDPNSRKVRRGVVGGYVDDLSADDLAYIRQRARGADCSFVKLCPQSQVAYSGNN